LPEEWMLTIGTHNGTLVGRDVADPVVLGSLEECKEHVKAARTQFVGLGQKIWFASVVGPDGKEQILEQDNLYV
jgi:hypothetical protein